MTSLSRTVPLFLSLILGMGEFALLLLPLTSFVYKDFAQSPSKMKATFSEVREQYPEHKLVACMELHTFSSLTEEFLKQYAGCMDCADIPIVFFDPHAVALKKLPSLHAEAVSKAFDNDKMEVFDDSNKLKTRLLNENNYNTVFLLMSSGNFGGIDVDAWGRELAD